MSFGAEAPESCKTKLATTAYLIQQSMYRINALKNPSRLHRVECVDSVFTIWNELESFPEFEQRKKDLAQAAIKEERNIAVLEKSYSFTFTKCLKHMSKAEIYEANKKFARTQQEMFLDKADSHIKKGAQTLASFEVDHARKWSNVAEELDRRESEKRVSSL